MKKKTKENIVVLVEILAIPLVLSAIVANIVYYSLT